MGVSDDIYQKLFNWIYYVLNTVGGYDVPIIESRQNKPAPDGTYIVIDRFVGMGKIGRATKNYPGDASTGDTKITTDYKGTVTIWEIEGDGDYLRELVTTLEKVDVYSTYFVKENIAGQVEGAITPIPRLNNEEWTEQAMLEVNISFADVTTEQSGWIEEVEFINNISHGEE